MPEIKPVQFPTLDSLLKESAATRKVPPKSTADHHRASQQIKQAALRTSTASVSETPSPSDTRPKRDTLTLYQPNQLTSRVKEKLGQMIDIKV